MLLGGGSVGAGPCALSAQEHQKNIDVARTYTGNATGLRKRFGLYALQLLPALRAEIVNLAVIEATLELDILQAAHLFGKHLFAFGISFILHAHFSGLYNLFFAIGNLLQQFVESRYLGSQIAEVYLRTGYQFGQLNGETEWGSAYML